MSLMQVLWILPKTGYSSYEGKQAYVSSLPAYSILILRSLSSWFSSFLFLRYGRWDGNSYESSSEETIALLIFICILQVISMYPAQRGITDGLVYSKNGWSLLDYHINYPLSDKIRQNVALKESKTFTYLSYIWQMPSVSDFFGR